MPDERWSEISRVCHEALRRDGAERAAYLDTACGGDPDLRRQVEGLLQEEGREAGFLSAPAWEDAVRAGKVLGTPDARREASPPRLEAGARLGPYEVLGFIGAGGMGEVYRARDTRLDRIVALKRLPVFAAEPAHSTLPEEAGSAPAGAQARTERAARFAREAHALACLNHPNICTLYDIAAEGGTTVLVMEYLDGETLAARLRKRPLPTAVACEIGARIADALAAAHSLGIIHRDLKPPNVMLLADRSGGSAVPGVKLLDFGLAKLRGQGETAAVATGDGRPGDSVTARGVVMGTPAYSSPEQLEGRPADGRTDIWALGVILYEMLAGKPAFRGDSPASLMGQILESEPARLSTVHASVPPALERLVARCLAKDPAERWQAAGDVAAELRWVAGQIPGATATRPVRAFLARHAAKWGLFGGAVALVAAAATWWLVLRPGVPTIAGIGLDVRPAEQVDAGGWGLLPRQVPTPGGSRTALAWTPDGRTLVFVGRAGDSRQLYVRPLDSAGAMPLPGTEGAQVPAVSPDGAWVAFWVKDKGVRKVPIAGGPVIDLMPGPTVPPFGMAWGIDGDLYIGHEDRRIWVIRSDGRREAVTSVGTDELSHVLPCPLPDGRTILYTVRRRWWTWGDEEVVAQTLRDGKRKVLLHDAADARFIEAGFLVFLRRGQLMAVRFDAARLEPRGLPVVVLDPVAQALAAPNPRDITGAGQYAVSAAGTLAWIRAATVSSAGRAIVSVDREGRVAQLSAPLRDYIGLRVSPDGRRLATQLRNTDGMGISVLDLERGTLSPLVRQGESSFARWSADGREILFHWRDRGRASLAWLRADSDGTVPPREFAPVPDVKLGSIGRDGRVLGLRDDRQMVSVSVENGQPRVEPLHDGGQAEAWPALSPDGRWVVYGSDGEIWVRPFPGPGAAVSVSVGGGRDPIWNPTGREIFYAVRRANTARGRMMAVDFTSGNPPRIGPPRSLFDFDDDLWFLCTTIACYDAAPDGRHFYVIQTRPQQPLPPVTHINVVPGWSSELKARVPGEVPRGDR